jgi:cytochrome c peroxidase
VPLGLPDPTPNIPPTNRPTHGKWLLGKKLFFDKTLLTGVSRHLSQSCSDCHRPAEGYTVNSERTPTMPRLNPPTLINCVYNKRQFWDGRVAHLEEVIQRTLEDEPAPGKPPEEDVLGYRHAWPEVVAKVRRRYNEDFVRVFGSVATQDSIGKALATYMRTILSGHSVYDRAEAERIKAKAPTLQADHFEPFLNERTREALGAQKLTAGQTAVELRHGAELFRGKARCALCHGGPLFTDQDYHNLGVGESEYARNGTRGLETGRFPHLPAGLKDRRYIGAFATPTLRALPRTAPYMHDGSRGSLEGVVKYFNSGIDAEDNPYLAPELLEGRGKARKLDLDDRDVRALVLFLRALDGDPIPKIVAEP